MHHNLARILRRNMTDVEKAVWTKLRGKQLAGHRFRRQAAVGPYIADFICYDPRVVLELDGGQHAEQVAKDAERTAWFESQGFRVLRYWNHQVFEEWDVIEQELSDALTAGRSPSDPPPVGSIRDSADLPHKWGGKEGGRGQGMLIDRQHSVTSPLVGEADPSRRRGAGGGAITPDGRQQDVQNTSGEVR